MEEEAKKALKNKVLVLMFLRALLALVFLGVTTWFQVRQYSFSNLNPYPLYAIVVLIGIVTIIYALSIKWVKNLRLFIYLQVTVDIAIITVTVYVTGGMESYLQVLYFLSIIGASIMLSKRGGYYAASLASISYGVLIDLDFYSLLPAPYKMFPLYFNHRWDEAITTIVTNIMAYFLVALLTGYLARKTERVERRLEEQTIDFDKLSRLNKYIVENIASGIMTVDDRSRITSFNRSAEIISGYSLLDVYNRDVDELFPDTFTTDSVIPEGKFRLEKMVKTKGGDDVFIGFRFSRGSDDKDEHIIIFQDLSKLRSMEDQLRRAEKLKALGEISVGIAHEVRNPLASISGSIQVLREQASLQGDDLSLMEIVLRETERLNELITDFLLFARPAPQQRGIVNLSEVIKEKILLLGNSAEASGITIENRIDDMISIEGDARQLGQVFWNIFINSVNAIDKKGGAITVSSSSSGDSAGEGRPLVHIEISDSGRGMENSAIKKIFDPFYSTRENGTGLGLAIAHSIIQSHGGSIVVTSAPGEGSKFTVSLPLLQQNAPEVKSPSYRENEPHKEYVN
ncbi:MAG: nitrogen regulation protein NR(II) [Thermodesulfobacteriota bacterium]